MKIAYITTDFANVNDSRYPYSSFAIHVLQHFLDDGHSVRMVALQEGLSLEDLDDSNELLLLDGDFGIDHINGDSDYDVVFIVSIWVPQFLMDECPQDYFGCIKRFCDLNKEARIWYWDTDSEYLCASKTRISCREYIQDQCPGRVTLLVNDHREVMLFGDPIHLPMVVNRGLCEREIHPHVGDTFDPDYLLFMIGTMTGRGYMLEVVNCLSQKVESNLPILSAVPYFDNIKLSKSSDGLEIKTAKGGRIPRRDMFGYISRCMFHVHGGSWWSPRVRPGNIWPEPPSHYTLKLIEPLHLPESLRPAMITSPIDSHHWVSNMIPLEITLNLDDISLGFSKSPPYDEILDISREFYRNFESVVSSGMVYDRVKSELGV